MNETTPEAQPPLEALGFEVLDEATFRAALDQLGVELTDRPLTDQEVTRVLEEINAEAVKKQISPLEIMSSWLGSLKNSLNQEG